MLLSHTKTVNYSVFTVEMCVTDMLESIGKLAGFLTVTGLTLLAVLVQYFRQNAENQPVAVNIEVTNPFTFILSVSPAI